MLRLGLALASNLLDAPLPRGVMKVVQADSMASQVAEELKRNLLAHDPHLAGVGERLRYRRQMVQGYLKGWRYAARLALAPAEEDWDSARVYGRWRPFNSVLRPFRLLRKFRPGARSEQHIPS